MNRSTRRETKCSSLTAPLYDSGNGNGLVNIVVIIDSLQRHGAQRFLTQLVRGLQERGYTQTVITLNDVGADDVEESLVKANCKVIRIGRRAFLLGGFGWWQLIRILRRLHPDVVMTMLDFADTLGRPAARVAGCPAVVTSIRARNLAKPAWQRWLDRKTIPWARKVVFNSEQIVAYGRATEGVRPEQVVVIPNGVEDLRARATGLRREYRRQLGIPDETVLLGAVGRLHRQKNTDLLLQSVAKVGEGDNWKMVVLGDGPERKNLVRLAATLGLEDRVIWLGERADVDGWYAAMDIFVHSARFEGMPNAVMEAMASGLAVVASNVDGTKDLIDNGRTGYLVDPGDLDSFVARISQLLSDPRERGTMGEEAHDEMLKRFSVHRMVLSYDQLFRSLRAIA